MLDFTKVHKKFLNVTLTNGSVYLIRMPTKRVFGAMLELQDAMKVANDPDTDIDTAKEKIDLLYDLTCEIMSNNIGGKQINSEELSKIFDIEDIQMFFNSYYDFVTGTISADPN